MSEHVWQRTPVVFPAVDLRDVLHAVTRRTTRCGIPLSPSRLAGASGQFLPGGDRACPRCSERVAATPGRQSTQEQLCRLIGDAEPAALRDKMIAALEAGASINPWTIAPADTARRHARMHEATEGAAECLAALAAGDATVGVAEVVTGGSRLVAIMPAGARTAIMRRPVERQAAPAPQGWSFADARVPADFGAGRSGDAVEHAVDGDATLCGVPAAAVVLHRHLFRAGRSESCPRCGALAAAAPDRPGAQERLHALIADAEPDEPRDDLAEALERGAEVTLWINGPGPAIGQHYGKVEQLTEGREAIAAALAAGAPVGLAQVLHGNWRSTVVLRDGERPLIGRAQVGDPPRG